MFQGCNARSARSSRDCHMNIKVLLQPARLADIGGTMGFAANGSTSGGRDFHKTYDLEQQLYSAERRYAQARAQAEKARQEWRELSTRNGARADDVAAALSHFEAIADRCSRLRSLIDKIEEKLEG
jgi:chromosome segregation ATPase